MSLSSFAIAFLLIAGPLLAVPDDLEDSYQQLKAAEAKKDAASVKKLAPATCALARQMAAMPAPENTDKETWDKRIAYAREIETYTEYALCSAAMQAPAADTVELLSMLEQQNPKSKYLDDAYGRYFLALTQTGAASKIPGVAEKALAHFPDNEDLLLIMSDATMSHKQTDRALANSHRLIAVLLRHPRPESMSAADWDRKRTAALARAYWIAGLMHCEKLQYYDGDKDLRAALPMVKGDEAMFAAALFYLGIANYQLGKTLLKKDLVLEAVKFSEQAAALKCPMAQQAWRNAAVMKAEAGKMR